MNEVKIYILDCGFLSDSAVFDEQLKNATARRREKINRLKFDSDKRLELGADILFRRALCEYSKAAEKTNGYGKPYIEGCRLDYSISHSGSFAMLAVSENKVGCDIQKIDGNERHGVAKKFFTQSENRLIESGKLDFFRLWTLKESYIKMLGTGLKTPLDSFEVELNNGAAHISGCAVKEYFSVPGYAVSVCSDENAIFKFIKE